MYASLCLFIALCICPPPFASLSICPCLCLSCPFSAYHFSPTPFLFCLSPKPFLLVTLTLSLCLVASGTLFLRLTCSATAFSPSSVSLSTVAELLGSRDFFTVHRDFFGHQFEAVDSPPGRGGFKGRVKSGAALSSAALNQTETSRYCSWALLFA